jgi:TolB protein
VSARDGGGNCEVYVMDADGSRQRRLTRTPDDEFFLAWSPEGERIAYTDYSGDATYLAVMNADGSGRRSLGASLIERATSRVYGEEPAWSPAGEHMAFASYADKDNEEIHAMAPPTARDGPA